MKEKALLVMAHQGRSYIKLIRAYLDALNVTCLVVSSQPRDEQDLALLREHSAQVWVLPEPYISAQGVADVLQEASQNYEVLNTLATFEAYRLIMAQANQQLSGLDADPQALALCMDKFACRQALHAQSLSEVESFILDDAVLTQLQQGSQSYFIKPRRGAGSFACFRLSSQLQMADVQRLQAQMQDDKQFAAIFNGQFDFMAESFIAGEEFSFETLVLDGECYVIGAHAKYLQESMGTTLEVSNSLPASNLSDAEQRSGEAFVAACLKGLGLNQGAYHIETRFDRQRNHWEIIEINTRMGGALINQSVEVFTNGESFLKLWIELLCLHCNRAQLKEKLAGLRESQRRASRDIDFASVFISRYGEPGKTLTHLNIDRVSRQPDIIEIPVRVGTQLAASERGIFLCNALWRVTLNELPKSLETLPAMFDAGMEVGYAD
ncbi:ATP-grasp domain-containing protein [Pseudoalteromonas rubra]|uniref:ATP-grasp domain-containing protein n=1 Tax=Pseudoalteromonas rubra TaxID=43658 RepID=UPI0019813C5E|nr:ATP-grasp domain-containing protein [Pseudoalteromonas rubra]